MQSAGQIADLGGGALMAAVGILVALREREVSGEGQLVDVSMADGALSWLAMVAARMLAEDVAPARGGLELAGGLVCYRPYACADGYVTLGALEPKFWQAFCRGVGREDLIEHHLDPAGSGHPARGRGDLRRAHARRVGGVRGRARLLPRAGARPRRGARLRARARARDGGRDRPARRRAPGPPARRADQALAHARRPGGARTRARAGHPRGARRLGYTAEEIERLARGG